MGFIDLKATLTGFDGISHAWAQTILHSLLSVGILAPALAAVQFFKSWHDRRAAAAVIAVGHYSCVASIVSRLQEAGLLFGELQFVGKKDFVDAQRWDLHGFVTLGRDRNDQLLAVETAASTQMVKINLCASGVRPREVRLLADYMATLNSIVALARSYFAKAGQAERDEENSKLGELLIASRLNALDEEFEQFEKSAVGIPLVLWLAFWGYFIIVLAISAISIAREAMGLG
ncbi:MAG: hypothetical protein ACREHE_04640 [Rhizomicrobium sp.]